MDRVLERRQALDFVVRNIDILKISQMAPRSKIRQVVMGDPEVSNTLWSAIQLTELISGNIEFLKLFTKFIKFMKASELLVF